MDDRLAGPRRHFESLFGLLPGEAGGPTADELAPQYGAIVVEIGHAEGRAHVVRRAFHEILAGDLARHLDLMDFAAVDAEGLHRPAASPRLGVRERHVALTLGGRL